MISTSNQISTWVEKYTEAMLNWAYQKVGNRETAEDLVQDTFVAAHKSIETFQNKSQPKTWLFSILKNKIADYYRKQFKLKMVNESDMGNDEQENVISEFFTPQGDWLQAAIPGNWESSQEELLDDIDFRQVLSDCLDGLQDKSNLAIRYKFFEEKKGGEICKELGITPSNFWQILHRAKLQLRRCIENNWFNKID